MGELTRREREYLEKKEAVISKAAELFCKYGFEKVSMDTIARESEFTKKTIYRYFTCKEDLFFAAALKSYQQLLDTMKRKSRKGKTGFEKIRLSYYAYHDYYFKFPQLAQLINMSGIIKSRSEDVEVPYREKFLDLDRCLFDHLIQMFQEARIDRSIRSDLDASTLALSSVFVATGFFQMLSLSGNTYTNHFDLDQEGFVKFTIEMLLDSLKDRQDSE